MHAKGKVLLMILDGWGIGPKDETNAIFLAKTPFIDSLSGRYPHAQLLTDGLHVGLPEGQMGNSEVGHLNIGAGRVIYQDLVRINKSIADNSFFQNPALVEAFHQAKASGKKVHLMGLVSDGGVHSSQRHLHAILDYAYSIDFDQLYIHAFLDGRDTDPKSGLENIIKLENHLQRTKGKLASIIGRYYAMDRDKRWERIKLAYDLMVQGKGQLTANAQKSISEAYDSGTTDEFMPPICLHNENDEPRATIEHGDTVICFNFRTDRCREITQVLTQRDFSEFEMHKLELNYITMTNYDTSFEGVKVMFDKDNLVNTLGEVLADNNKTQLRIAETEKYPHVTFFFSGGREIPFSGEDRVMVPSPKVATYDLQPEMSALEVRDKAIQAIEGNEPDFICLNFANPDMVGHTGVFEAIKKACETVDSCAESVVKVAISRGYEVIIIADHGNADKALNPDGTPNTAHSTNPVPIYLISDRELKLNSGVLADVAPTILRLMEIDQPSEMTGINLLTVMP